MMIDRDFRRTISYNYNDKILLINNKRRKRTAVKMSLININKRTNNKNFKIVRILIINIVNHRDSRRTISYKYNDKYY